MVKQAQKAHIGVVVLSPSFITKNWTFRELQLMLGDISRTGEGRFTPLFYKVGLWHLHHLILACEAGLTALTDFPPADHRWRVQGHCDSIE